MRDQLDEIPDDVGLVERIAEAFHQALPTDLGTLARIALREARMPTGPMIDAGFKTFSSTGSNQYQIIGQPTLVWQTMLDTALKEPRIEEGIKE
jgi:hypothetical protein